MFEVGTLVLDGFDSSPLFHGPKQALGIVYLDSYAYLITYNLLMLDEHHSASYSSFISLCSIVSSFVSSSFPLNLVQSHVLSNSII